MGGDTHLQNHSTQHDVQSCTFAIMLWCCALWASSSLNACGSSVESPIAWKNEVRCPDCLPRNEPYLDLSVGGGLRNCDEAAGEIFRDIPGAQDIAAGESDERAVTRPDAGACSPDCDFKVCGSDGCGGTCGICPEAHQCSDDFTCVGRECSCLGNECGDDGCGRLCGTCAEGEKCVGQNGRRFCECVPMCSLPVAPFSTMECGPNACPTGCMDKGLGPCKTDSSCDVGQQCNALTGQCVECGACGVCPPGTSCDVTLDDIYGAYTCIGS